MNLHQHVALQVVRVDMEDARRKGNADKNRFWISTCLPHAPPAHGAVYFQALMEFDEEFERMTLEAWKDRTLHPYQKKIWS
ncbi:hypothetical protein AS888_21385 [Peribacillus simplex]|uniref:Uncharacterized protein n=1 Tax=Peribacillus simplex TaxID=1478 RepID=A0A125QRS2_9BACI|nr:hypothetical protein [Peribacillus simplex]KWW17579.1 hypothetical protein AS888_21385 [Peribacillus simplex]